MKNKNFIYFLNIIFGFGLSIFTLELIARFLPASDLLPLESPIICDDLSNIDLKCLHRRPKFISGRITKGNLPPFELNGCWLQTSIRKLQIAFENLQPWIKLMLS